MSRSLRSALLATLLAPVPALAAPKFDPAPDLKVAAKQIAEQAGAELVKHGPKEGGPRFRVAVFPFGNKDNRYPLALGDNGPILQAELVGELRAYLDTNAPGRFTVLLPSQLEQALKASAVDPQ